MIAFLNFNFSFFILLFPYFFTFFFHPYFLLLFFIFFHLFFSPPHMYPSLFFFFLVLLSPFSLPLPPEHSSFNRALFLFLFFFFLSLFSLTTSSASFFPSIPSKHTNLKVTHTTPFDSHQTKIEGEITKEGMGQIGA